METVRNMKNKHHQIKITSPALLTRRRAQCTRYQVFKVPEPLRNLKIQPMMSLLFTRTYLT